ncbi:hypothetical protein L6452_16810 [Arctium lappa]|uniref:Uncharacterized protein n=1 Tax=Arctium lappa TaxID=4217 RepID=A0ACB9C1V6_ARCLA|nr:hypothetical protein L6452_16810 [Arctium lappa]
MLGIQSCIFSLSILSHDHTQSHTLVFLLRVSLLYSSNFHRLLLLNRRSKPRKLWYIVLEMLRKPDFHKKRRVSLIDFFHS